MKIVHLVVHIKNSGNGVTNVVIDLACLQAKMGHEVLILSEGGDYKKLLEEYNVRHIELPHLGLKRYPFKLLKTAVQYRTIVSTFKPDIVHAHQIAGIEFAKFCRFGFKYHLISTVHCEFEKRAKVLGWADLVIAVSAANAHTLNQRGIPRKKLRVVTNGTLGSPRTQQLKDSPPLALKHPAISTVAGMNIRKGIAELIMAFEEVALSFPEANLYLVGDGPDRAIFESQAKSISVGDRIHFEGFQPHAYRYLLDTDIFVLASHQDPSPLVIPEAREAGCAIIASKVDGIPEALDGGNAGLLVEPKNSHALATAIKCLLEKPEVLKQWRDKAKTNLERMSALRVNEEILAVYQEALNNS
jgi:glycosyltransferase involved in cell wall biosynthesis